MAIYDCFPFFNELELLEMRMEILDKHVDYFVIQECNKTFQGKDKPLYFLENKDRYKKFQHKIIHSIFIDDMGTKWNNWDRDMNHRNHISDALIRCQDDDIILTSDADEIPNFDQNPISKIYDPNQIVHMMQRMYYYYLNVLKEENWFGTKICAYRYFKNSSFDKVRNSKNIGIRIAEGGWHFTFIGGIENVKTKIESWSHQEFNNDFIKNNIEDNIKNNRDIFYRSDSVFRTVPIDNSFPKYLIDNLSMYSQYIRSL